MWLWGTWGNHRLRTPSTAAGGPPPSKREVLGFRRSRPTALPSIAYRGFAVAPITLRAPSRSHLYNPGCRVATLLVLMGVMGFLGDLRGRNSKSPPNPLGLAERVPRPQAVEGVPPHSVESVYALNPHSILTAYSGCNSFAPKPSIFQPTVEIWSSGSAVPALPAGLTITRGFAPLRLVTP